MSELNRDNDLTRNDDTRTALGQFFKSSGAGYDLVRPSYPPQAYDAIMEFGGVHEGSRVLEVGCGSGIGTLPLAERGFIVDALDPSESLIRVAQQNLAGQENVSFKIGVLEDAELGGDYDAVLACQSIHWVSPAERWRRPHDLLQQDGVLAFMSNFPNTDPHTPDSAREAEVNELYIEQCPKFPAADWGTLDRMTEELVASDLYQDPQTVRMQHARTYTREDYLALQRSYSWVGSLDESGRQTFLTAVGGLIENAETVTVPFDTVLVMARRRPE